MLNKYVPYTCYDSDVMYYIRDYLLGVQNQYSVYPQYFEDAVAPAALRELTRM